jgi:hypothetical protein
VGCGLWAVTFYYVRRSRILGIVYCASSNFDGRTGLQRLSKKKKEKIIYDYVRPRFPLSAIRPQQKNFIDETWLVRATSHYYCFDHYTVRKCPLGAHSLCDILSFQSATLQRQACAIENLPIKNARSCICLSVRRSIYSESLGSVIKFFFYR